MPRCRSCRRTWSPVGKRPDLLSVTPMEQGPSVGHRSSPCRAQTSTMAFRENGTRPTRTGPPPNAPTNSLANRTRTPSDPALEARKHTTQLRPKKDKRIPFTAQRVQNPTRILEKMPVKRRRGSLRNQGHKHRRPIQNQTYLAMFLLSFSHPAPSEDLTIIQHLFCDQGQLSENMKENALVAIKIDSRNRKPVFRKARNVRTKHCKTKDFLL